MRAGPDGSPVRSFGRAACPCPCISWAASPNVRGGAARDLPASAAGIRFAPDTTNENVRRSDSTNGCRRGGSCGTESAGSREPKFSPDDVHATHHICQLLARRPTSGLAESAVGREGELLRRSVLQAKAHPLGNIFGSLYVVALHVNNSNGNVDRALCDFPNHFDLGELRICHLQVHFIHRQVEERRKQRGIPPGADGAPFVIAKAKMRGKSAPACDRLDRLGEDLNKTARIFPVRVAAHRRLVECDFAATALHQLLEFFTHNWNQRFGYIPTTLLGANRMNSATQLIGPGNARF